MFADSSQPLSSSCPLAQPCLCVFLLLPGRRRGTVICAHGGHQSPVGRLQPAPSCSPPLSCCSGTAESSGCSCSSDRFHTGTQMETQNTSTFIIYSCRKGEICEVVGKQGLKTRCLLLKNLSAVINCSLLFTFLLLLV